MQANSRAVSGATPPVWKSLRLTPKGVVGHRCASATPCGVYSFADKSRGVAPLDPRLLAVNPPGYTHRCVVRIISRDGIIYGGGVFRPLGDSFRESPYSIRRKNGRNSIPVASQKKGLRRTGIPLRVFAKARKLTGQSPVRCGCLPRPKARRALFGWAEYRGSAP